jgi:cytochrome bd-type quinol oxidase subunit 2
VEVSIPCVNCVDVIRPTDEFCQGCGARVSSDQKARLLERLEIHDTRMAAHMKHVRSARQGIITLAALFAIAGLVMFFLAKSESDSTLVTLRALPEDMTYPELINGQSLTIAEVRTMIEREPLEILALNLVLAAIMAGLWVWGKRAALPAIIAALAVFVTVHVANALVDPATIVQGLAMKIIGTVILVRGVRSGLESRRIEQAQRV